MTFMQAAHSPVSLGELVVINWVAEGSYVDYKTCLPIYTSSRANFIFKKKISSPTEIQGSVRLHLAQLAVEALYYFYPDFFTVVVNRWDLVL